MLFSISEVRGTLSAVLNQRGLRYAQCSSESARSEVRSETVLNRRGQKYAQCNSQLARLEVRSVQFRIIKVRGTLGAVLN